VAKGPNGNGKKLSVVETGSDVDVVDPYKAELEAARGATVSRRLEDNVLPLVRLLQTNSPEVNRRNAGYVEGANPGDWYFRDAPKEIVRGEEGFDMQPLFLDHVYVQWKPDRGGFSGKTYPFNDVPPEARDRIDIDSETGAQRNVLGMPNGDYLEDTIYIYGMVDKRLWVVPCRSTGLTIARRFNQALSFLQFDGEELAIFGSTWRFTTRMAQNKKGEWFIPHFAKTSQFARPDAQLNVPVMPLETFRLGRKERGALMTDLKTGARMIEIPAQDETVTGAVGSAARDTVHDDGPGEDIPF
jgi:hypothetical protein